MPRPEPFDFSHLSADKRLPPEEGSLTDAQKRELDSRCAALDSGELKIIPWEEVKHSLFSGE